MRSFFINRQYRGLFLLILLLHTLPRHVPPMIAFHNITFHPVNNSIKPIVNCNFNLLNSDSSTCNIFSQRPLFSLKKNRNLRTFLVKGTLPSNKEPGTFRCSRKRCLTCTFVVSRTTVTGPKSTPKGELNRKIDFSSFEHLGIVRTTIWIYFKMLAEQFGEIWCLLTNQQNVIGGSICYVSGCLWRTLRY